ncbi:MAG: 16S rRNA (cytosine(1402)-N(4))-methyltransferase RsmH [Eubacteriales bacterium]|nr:16S rRNA (cytosine(1402)-N(4))-methyltransferase RsmH [Eubacteriales bacterium]MDD3199046.1 16S rRNA (cytosine(1402)-N(4))-methyltransferase RsmH [Eubacteriales bacterium]MDD4629468.1 16S rRNA (cytosine(1402)-N(4))-methyltransferase RsmH [Eubacteriales bacterium]
MEFKHTSVLLLESIRYLNIDPEGIYADGTLGGGGHASGICEKLNQTGILIGIDRDADAIGASEERLKSYPCKKIFVRDNYANIKNILKSEGINSIQGAILDLGVSSFQLDNFERGFSYMQDALLDMRMNRDDPLTAEIVVNEYRQNELTDIIRKYGEERWASRISEFIVKERQKHRIRTTSDLVEIIKSAIPASARREGPHPAKRTFQAIRIEVNDELSKLGRAVDDFIDVLDDRGRLCIITFHSLEDRIVKETFNRRTNPCTCPKDFPVCVCGKKPDVKKINSKPVLPTTSEIDMNPRARSAKLRIIEKRL